MKTTIVFLFASLFIAKASFARNTSTTKVPSQAGNASACKKLTPVKNFELSAIVGSTVGGNSCTGNQCPRLSCRKFTTGLPYADVDSGYFAGSMFQSIGYSENLTKLVNSDFREVRIKSLLSANLSGSNFQNAVIETIAVGIDLTKADLRGARIGQIDDLSSITLTGAIYDSTSTLPFTDEVAAEKGMIKISNEVKP